MKRLMVSLLLVWAGAAGAAQSARLACAEYAELARELAAYRDAGVPEQQLRAWWEGPEPMLTVDDTVLELVYTRLRTSPPVVVFAYVYRACIEGVR